MKIIKLFIVIFLIPSPLMLWGQGISGEFVDRHIYLVHGLGGDETNWDVFKRSLEGAAHSSTGFPGYRVRPFSDIDYSLYQELGMESSASHLNTLLKARWDAHKLNDGLANNAMDNSQARNNIAIGHSQGGLVARRADQYLHQTNAEYNRAFGGIVTVGTPNGGARILNNLEPKLIPLTNEVCSTFSNAAIQGAIVQAVNNNFILRTLINPRKISESLSTAACDGLFSADLDDGFNVLTLVAGHFTSEITEEYKVGASEINGLNNFHEQNPTAIHKAAFYGDKAPEDVFWKTVYYFTNNPSNEGYFGATNDNMGVTQAQDIYMDLIAERDMYTELINQNCYDLWFLGLLANLVACKKKKNNWRNSREAYNEAIGLWESLNDKWLDAIGAIGGINVVYTTTCGCYNSSGNFVFSFPTSGSCPSSISGYTCQAIGLSVSYQTTYKPSDGVVLVESQKAFPGTTSENHFRMIDCSHMQERNHPELARGMKDYLFMGELGGFFQTDPR